MNGFNPHEAAFELAQVTQLDIARLGTEAAPTFEVDMHNVLPLEVGSIVLHQGDTTHVLPLFQFPEMRTFEFPTA